MAQQSAVLTGIQRVDIHGSHFYDLTFDQGNGRAGNGRVGVESVYADPRVGDRIQIQLVLGQVVSVEKTS